MWEKESWALPKGGSLDHGGSSQRGGEREKAQGKKKVKTCAGDCARKLFPITTDGEKC